MWPFVLPNISNSKKTTKFLNASGKTQKAIDWKNEANNQINMYKIIEIMKEIVNGGRRMSGFGRASVLKSSIIDSFMELSVFNTNISSSAQTLIDSWFFPLHITETKILKENKRRDIKLTKGIQKIEKEHFLTKALKVWGEYAFVQRHIEHLIYCIDGGPRKP